MYCYILDIITDGICPRLAMGSIFCKLVISLVRKRLKNKKRYISIINVGSICSPREVANMRYREVLPRGKAYNE